MPEIVYNTLIANATPLAAGAVVESAVVDVNGARTVNLMFSIPSNDADVRWGVHFGPTTNNGYAQTRHGTFESYNTIAISVPVFGPGLLLVVENGGQRAETVDGKVYFIRDLP
jgi:hypothetical protein